MTPQTTPLYYSLAGGAITGLAFAIGPTLLFAPCDTDTLHLVDPAALTITARVPDLFARFLTETVIEPRLRRVGEGRP